MVAEEVRNLAIRSAEAAKVTAELIESTVKRVAEGAKLIDKTGQAFSKGAANNGKTGALVAEIASAPQEQVQGIDQITKAAAEMDAITQNAAATAEESASASEILNVQARRMKGSVDELIVLVRWQSTKSMRIAKGEAMAFPPTVMSSNGGGKYRLPGSAPGLVPKSKLGMLACL